MILVYSIIFSVIQMGIITTSSYLFKIDELFGIQIFRKYPAITTTVKFLLGVALWYIILNFYGFS